LGNWSAGADMISEVSMMNGRQKLNDKWIQKTTLK